MLAIAFYPLVHTQELLQLLAILPRIFFLAWFLLSGHAWVIAAVASLMVWSNAEALQQWAAEFTSYKWSHVVECDTNHDRHDLGAEQLTQDPARAPSVAAAC